ncbi:MAG: FHA domain-containing protein [Lachnospiraceae bacterium]|nr:FHA domain-containing protein [Lachnospiraceae bacterium]
MNITYKRNGTKTYLVVCKEGGDESDFREKMLMRNRIQYMAKMQSQIIDGVTCYYYDIQGRVSLSAVFAGRTMSSAQIQHFLRALSVFFSETERYMLLPEEVLFDPDAIWLSPDTLDPEFIYIPGMHPDSSCSIEKLAVFLTEHTDETDREAAEYAYSYMETVENGYYLPNVKQTAAPDADEAPMPAEDIPAEREEYPDMSADAEEDMSALFEKQPSGAIRAYLCLGGAAVAAVIYVLLVLYPSLFPFYLDDNEYMITGVSIAVLFALVLVSVMHMHSRKRTADELPEEEPCTFPDPLLSPAPVKSPGYVQPPADTFSFPDDDRTVLLRGAKPHRQGPLCPSLQKDGGGSIQLQHFPFIVGKMSERVDGVINDEGISRIHAMIKEQDGKYYISDLNSLNGTGVNGRMLDANETAQLSDGDRVSLAGSSFTFRCA